MAAGRIRPPSLHRQGWCFVVGDSDHRGARCRESSLQGEAAGLATTCPRQNPQCEAQRTMRGMTDRGASTAAVPPVGKKAAAVAAAAEFADFADA